MFERNEFLVQNNEKYTTVFLQDFPTFWSFCEVLKIKGWSII